MGSEILDATSVAQTFPILPVPLIARDTVLDTLTKVFDSGSDVVLLSGDDGAGKTIVCAQFAKSNSERSLSLFVRAASSFAYDPNYLRHDLYAQICWLLRRQEPRSAEGLAEAEYNLALYALQKQARKNPIYFIVDGLDEITGANAHQRQAILALLPFGLPGFRFLVSAPLSTVVGIPTKIASRPLYLPALTIGETSYFFGDLGVDRPQAEEFWKLTRGAPGYLASIRRLLESGTPANEILDGTTEQSRGLYELEWQRLDLSDDLQQLLLAIVANDPARRTLADLARMTATTPESVKEKLAQVRFLEFDEKAQEFSFVAEALRQFVTAKLSHLRERAQGVVIDDLLSTPESATSLTELPKFYRAAGRLDDLINYLSPDFFSAALDKFASLPPLIRTAQLGVSAAYDRHRDDDLLRLATNRSVLAGVESTEAWRAEIEARMALGDPETALAVAQGATLKEDRLELLAAIAKGQKSRGAEPDPEVVAQIRQLYDQLDVKALGNRSFRIASDLLYAAPELALQLVEATKLDPTASLNRDVALAQLSIHAFNAATVDAKNDRDATSSAIRAGISDPAMQEFSAAVAILLRDVSAERVIAESFKISNAQMRVYYLRQWTLRNRRRADASQVMQHALEIIVERAEYTPNARDVRQLAMPFPFLKSKEVVESLVRTLDGLKGSFEKHGPTVDFVRLQLLIGEAEAKHGISFETRLLEIFFVTSSQTDLALKAECLAYILAFLFRVDQARALERTSGIHSEVERDLNATIDLLLADCADHYEITRGALHALASTRIDIAEAVAMRLNLAPRRDRALRDIVVAAANPSRGTMSLGDVATVLAKLTNDDLIDDAVTTILRRLDQSWKDAGVTVDDVRPFLDRIKNISDATDRCHTCVRGLNILSQAGAPDSSGLIDTLHAAWQSIDPVWVRIRGAFDIAAQLAPHRPEDAKQYLSRVDELKDETAIQTAESAVAHMSCLRLAIAAAQGVMVKPSSGDLERLKELIGFIPSYGEQAVLWADLALRYVRAGVLEGAQAIVRDHVRPLYARIADGDILYRRQIFAVIAPALDIANEVTTREELQRLPIHWRDHVVKGMIRFRMTKEPLFEPCDTLTKHTYSIRWDDVVKIFELIKFVTADNLAYGELEEVADTIAADVRGRLFTREHKSDVTTRLRAIASQAFPRPGFIQHHGYAILSEAQALRIEDAKGGAWKDVVTRGQAVPNVADRVFVLTGIAAVLPSRESSLRRQVLTEIRALIPTIPCAVDRASRLKLLAEEISYLDRPTGRQILRDAITATFGGRGAGIETVRRRIIDYAHSLDPDLAASLAALSDDDPARDRERRRLEERVKILNVQDRLAEGHCPPANIPHDDYSDAAWSALGKLNAGRLTPQPLDKLRDQVNAAANMSIGDSTSVLTWVIANVVGRYGNTDQAARMVRPVFESMLRACQVSARTASRAAYQATRQRAISSDILAAGEGVVIHEGQRDVAITYLKDWISTTVSEYLKICDPYFGLDDLEILKWVLAIKPSIQVYILSSLEQQKRLQPSVEEAYRTHWRLGLSSAEPPDTLMVFCSTESGKFPVHDRWWLTKGGGLDLGTSLNSLGTTKLSKINPLSETEAQRQEAEVDKLITRMMREHHGERVVYRLFNM